MPCQSLAFMILGITFVVESIHTATHKSMAGGTCHMMLLRSSVCVPWAHDLLALADMVGLGTEVGSSRARVGEVTSEGWLQERAEDELSTAVAGCVSIYQPGR